MLHAVAQSLLDLFFPPRCLSCGASGAILCDACMQKMPPPPQPLCSRCGRTLSGVGLPCKTCVSGRGPVALATLRAATVYGDVARNAVRALKYRGQRRVAEPLGDLLAAAAQREGFRPDMIVPTPLHTQRQRERGYNQSELLARRCASRLGIPCQTKILTRPKATRPQVGLSLIERRANVTDAFALASTVSLDVLRGKRILLIDDVATTGNTMDMAAKTLMAAGCDVVWGLAVAQPTLGDDTFEQRRTRNVKR